MALADIVTAHSAALTGVTVWLGEEFIAKNDAPPRVVWVPTAETYQSAGRVGTNTALRYPRTVGTRIAGVELHIWGAGAAGDTDPYKDLRAAELLIDRVIYFLRQVALGSFSINGGQWLPVSQNHLGRGYVLQLLFRLPIVPAAADDASTVTTFTDVTPMEGTHVADPLHTPTGDVTGTPAP